MVRFSDGDRSAFAQVFRELWPIVLDFCSRNLSPAADAEDAAQQALLKVFSRIVDLDRERDGVSWALAIASYEVMTIRRKRGRRREVDDSGLDSIVDARASQEDHVVATQLRASVMEMLGQLSQPDQEMLSLVLDGAALPPGETPRKRRTRAIDRLRSAWRKMHD